ncbi:MAG: glycosyltransferase [bacterium]
MLNMSSRYDFVIDTCNHYYFKPHNFSTVRAHYLFKGLKKLGYSCFLRRKNILEWLLTRTKSTERFGKYVPTPIPPARFLINTSYQMRDADWDELRKEYEKARISYFFNMQDFSIGDLKVYFTNQTRWFREHGANLCHALLEKHKSEREYFIGSGVDPKLLQPNKEKLIPVECGYRTNRKKIEWFDPTICIEIYNKALKEFQKQGYRIVMCADTFKDICFSFPPNKKFKYSNHVKFAEMMNCASIYIAKEESYGLPLAEAQMSGTVLVLRAGGYPKEMILTEKFSEYEGAKFENGVFINIDESAESLKKAIRRAMQITQEKDCYNKIRNSVLNQFDYMSQSKRVTDICLAIEKSKNAGK